MWEDFLMEKQDVYSKIAKRTGGDIYIGVVGPVRTGKSTVVKSLMEHLILPNISGKNAKQIATDEMPQSADGKTIMTTEPKFIPSTAVKISLKNKITAKVRLIDCVGFLVDGALGHEENDKPRLVKTPWDSKEIPFEKAAEIGTEKVIKEHSTIAIVVTTDGSFGELPRANFIGAEERVIGELKQLNKPFVIFLNSANPDGKDAIELKNSLYLKHGVPVILGNAKTITADGISEVLEQILYEFPMQSIDICLPKWMQSLSSDNEIIKDIAVKVKERTSKIYKMKDFHLLTGIFGDDDKVSDPVLSELNLGDGVATYTIDAKEGLFFEVLSKEAGDEIKDDYELMSYVKSLAEAKREYMKVKTALKCAWETGYGIVMPSQAEMTLSEPELIKKGGSYGVKLKANAPSLHIMKVDVEGEVKPIVGTEKQGEELAQSIMKEFESDPQKIWDTNMLGKSLYELMEEGLVGKLNGMPTSARDKMRQTLGKIVNEGDGGIICILL